LVLTGLSIQREHDVDVWTTRKYYSNKSARYFTYDNPRDFGTISVDLEIEALKSAMAVSVATGRILILPTFRCCSAQLSSEKFGTSNTGHG
jgi:hypothetical protein